MIIPQKQKQVPTNSYLLFYSVGPSSLQQTVAAVSDLPRIGFLVQNSGARNLGAPFYYTWQPWVEQMKVIWLSKVSLSLFS